MITGRAAPDPKGGADVKAGPLVVPTRDEALRSPGMVCLESSGEWTRSKADFVVDLSGENIDHSLLDEQRRQWHATYLRQTEDVMLFGYHHFHGILSPDRRIDCQQIDGVAGRLETHLQHHPGRKTPIPQIYRTRNGFRVSLGSVQPTEIESSVYFGTPTEPLNWGMWLLQGVPSAVDFVEHGRAEKFLAYAERDWQRRLLRALGIPKKALLHHELAQTYHCRQLTLRQYSVVDLAPTPKEKEVFAKIAREVAGVRQAVPKRRLFVARRSITQVYDGRYRALLNENELIDALTDRGYEVIEPELLSFREQIRRFSEARLVVGLGGAGLFNVIFSPPGTRVVTIESSAAFVHDHACLFSAMGHRFGVIFGREDSGDPAIDQKRWTLDVAGTVKALDAYEE